MLKSFKVVQIHLFKSNCLFVSNVITSWWIKKSIFLYKIWDLLIRPASGFSTRRVLLSMPYIYDILICFIITPKYYYYSFARNVCFIMVFIPGPLGWRYVSFYQSPLHCTFMHGASYDTDGLNRFECWIFAIGFGSWIR